VVVTTAQESRASCIRRRWLEGIYAERYPRAVVSREVDETHDLPREADDMWMEIIPLKEI